MVDHLIVVESTGFDPYKNLATEEYLLNALPAGSCILYLWQNDHTVVIGKNQNAWAECRTSLLSAESGRLARRLSGGGAVYHDLGNLNFTFICCEEDYDLEKNQQVLINACAHAGITAERSGRNDLLTNGRKFSGNAFYHHEGKAYHHGTILLSADIDKMTRYLSPPKGKLQAKGVSSVRSRVINLTELNPELTCARMKKYLVRAFEEVHGHKVTFLPEPADEALTSLISRYSSDSWIYGKSLPFTCQLESRFDWGHIQLLLDVKDGVINQLTVYSDGMDSSLAQQLQTVLKGCSLDEAHIKICLERSSIASQIRQDIYSLFSQVL